MRKEFHRGNETATTLIWKTTTQNLFSTLNYEYIFKLENERGNWWYVVITSYD